MTEEFDKYLKVNIESEKMFREKCDENNYTYMYIDQNIDKFSSKIYKDKSKRPDYILSVPYLGSIFVDVKAYTEREFFADSLKQKGKRVERAYWMKKDEILKFINLQEETTMKVWFAVIPTRNNNLLNETHFLPIDIARKFMGERHRTKNEWDYVQVPIECFRECNKLATNKCGFCKNKYCEQLEDLLKIDDQIHLEKYGKHQ
jgi:hypothetical protein